MLSLLEVGRRFGVRRRPKESENERGSLGTVEGAVFALFGLMVAFTFSGAATRFNEKRMLIAEEANAIGTAYLRLDLFPRRRTELQDLFRRLSGFSTGDLSQTAEYGSSQDGNGQIQKDAGRDLDRSNRRYALPDSHRDAGKLLLPALNNMIDMTTTRTWHSNPSPENHLCASLRPGSHLLLLAGYRMASVQNRSWLHIFGFTVMTVIIVYVMLDAEYPRAGLIRLASADQLLIDLRDGMKRSTK